MRPTPPPRSLRGPSFGPSHPRHTRAIALGCRPRNDFVMVKGEEHMEAYEAILTRRSVRAYTDRPVSDELIDKLLVAAMSAPSAGNGQPWHFGVITERTVLNALAELLPFGKMLQQAAAGDRGVRRNQRPALRRLLGARLLRRDRESVAGGAHARAGRRLAGCIPAGR